MAVDDIYTVSLLHMDGADASTTFTDESGKTWTAAGDAQIDTGQSVFGGASGLFDGTGDFITTPDHADWQLDSGSDANLWTVDFRVRFAVDPGTALVGFLHQRNDNSNFWTIGLNNNTLRFQVVSGGANIVLIDQGTWNPASGTWYHVAIVKNGTSGYLHFIDGTQLGTTTTDTSTMPDFTGVLQVGRSLDAAGAIKALNGWIDELRISKGVARWVANFTPPTAAYTPTQNLFFF